MRERGSLDASLEVGRGLHRRRRGRRESRLLGRQDLELHQLRRGIQARPGLLQLRRARRAGADAPALCGDAQRQARRPVDRRQQLQLRQHRHDVRRGLPRVDDLLRLLLQQRKLGHEQLHLEQRHQSQGRNRNSDQKRGHGDDQRGLHEFEIHDRGPGLSLADPQRLRIPLLPERLHPSGSRRLRLLERRRQLRQRHDAADDRQHRAQCGRGRGPVEREDDGTVLGLQQPPAVRQGCGDARGRGPRELESGRSGQQERVVQPDPHDRNAHRTLRAAPARPRVRDSTRPASRTCRCTDRADRGAGQASAPRFARQPRPPARSGGAAKMGP